MFHFSDITLQSLIAANWEKNRQIDVVFYKQVLTKEGYPFHNSVKKFLEEFGGLEVIHPHFRIVGKYDDFEIDPCKAIRHVFLERVEEDYNPRVDSKLCPIGEASRGHMVLLMNAKGEVYAGYDDFLIHVGSSGADAVDALCGGREMREIPIAVSP